jgi:uncharacterized protein YndB with AHSA1/START domain
MPVIEESVVINRPRDEVFASALDPSLVPIWATNVLEMAPPSGGQIRPGTQIRMTQKYAGKTYEAVGQPVEVDAGRRLRSRMEFPFPIELETRLEDADGGTRWTQRWTFDIPEGFFGELDDELVAKLYAIDLRSNFEKLKALLESR